MAVNELTINSFAGNDLTAGAYSAYFPADSLNVFNNPPYAAILSDRPGAFPVHVRGQEMRDTLLFEVQVLDLTKANIEQLKQWFDPSNGEQYLIVTDGDSVQRRILALPLELRWLDTNRAEVLLSIPAPVWEAATATEDEEAVTSSGQTWALSNAGNTKAYPKFTISPQSQIDHDDGFIHRRRVTIANRSERPVDDPIGDGYPIDLTENALDSDALNTAGKLQSDLDDLRLVLAGKEIHRWPDPATDDTTTKVWANLRFRPRKSATLAANITNSSPGDGDALNVSNAEGTAGWPNAGFLVIDNECIQYDAKTATAFVVQARSARNTTAASHTAAAVMYWVEHPFFDLIYDHTAATDPAPPDDRKPVINLAASLNTEHHWPGPFINANDRRSRAWQPIFTEDDPIAGIMRLSDSGTALTFEDADPEAGKPRYNNIGIDCPIPVTGSNALELDFTIAARLALRAYLLDRGGHESRLLGELWSDGEQADQQYTPAAAAYAVRLNAKHAAFVGSNPNAFTDDVRSISVADENNEIGQGFELEAEQNEIEGFVVRIRQADVEETDAIMSLWVLAGSEPEDGDANDSLFEETIDNADIPSAAIESAPDTVVLLASVVRAPAGAYVLAMEASDGAYDNLAPLQWADANHRAYAFGSVWDEDAGVWDEERGRSLLFALLSTTTPAQEDAPVRTGETIVVDDIELNYDSTRTPKIVLAPEEDMYLLNCRLKNDTTGDYLDLFFPMAVGASVEIDCATRTVTDLETGRPIPFALVASNPAEWISLAPGSNTMSYTEAGVVDTDVASEFRSRWL